jgi:hypothetical protein
MQFQAAVEALPPAVLMHRLTDVEKLFSSWILQNIPHRKATSAP